MIMAGAMASLREQIMRYTPAAFALALVVAVSASSSYSAPPVPLDPRAAALVQAGRSAMATASIDDAISDFEAALAIQPGHVAILLNLAEATRKQGMFGKALHYYRVALTIDPNNPYALAGEGETLVEKGAVEKAKRNYDRLVQLCGSSTCIPAKQLAAAIDKGPSVPVVTAQQVEPKPEVTAN